MSRYPEGNGSGICDDPCNFVRCAAEAISTLRECCVGDIQRRPAVRFSSVVVAPRYQLVSGPMSALAGGFNGSEQHRVHSIGGRVKAQGFSRALIEASSDFTEVSLRELR